MTDKALNKIASILGEPFCEPMVAAVDHLADPAEDARVQGLRDVEAARSSLLSLGFTSLGSGVWAGDDSQACTGGGTVSFTGGEYSPAALRALATLAEQGAS